MTQISPTIVIHVEQNYPGQWLHSKLGVPLSGERIADQDLSISFRDLVVSHQFSFLGAPETVLLPADETGRPASDLPLRTVQNQHAEPNAVVLHYLPRYATPR